MTWLLEGEPELAIDEIQGHSLIGFGSAEQTLGAFSARDLGLAAKTVGRWAGRVSSTWDLLERKGKSARRFLVERDSLVAQLGPEEILGRQIRSGPWVMLAVSHRLLVAAGAPTGFEDQLFTAPHGMSAITRLNDAPPIGGGRVGDDWVIGGPDSLIDVLIVVAAGTASAARELVDWFARDAEPWSNSSHVEALRPIVGSKEHFGFRDGISQPAVLGTIAGVAFEDPRLPDDGGIPFAAPGRQLVWPGTFVLGYPQNGGDPRRPGAPSGPRDGATAAFSRNGSYLVYRRLRQNVPRFRSFVRNEARRLRKSGSAVSPRELASMIVGRWDTGIPIAHDRLDKSADADVLNGFSFLNDRMSDVCPFAAHIRKVNPRSGAKEVDSVPRILRRGAPFGGRFRPGDPASAGEERGLTFLGYQASIDRQFRILMTEWMNGPELPTGTGGHDMITGQLPSGQNRFFDLDVGARDPMLRITAKPPPWVTMTGGGFLLAPSISALKSLAT